mmetsp:Transcript_7252/g.10922  ORF Transcript_7252/g.10922 Transcript_7252/m.10922 type:complete len:1551 (-) Transcript_7252:120-4772(-)
MPRTPSHFCHVNFILLLLFFGKCTHPSAATATLPSIHTKKLRGRADKRAAENDRRRRDAKPSISAPTPSSSSHSSLSSLRRRRRMFSVPMLFFPTGSPSLQTTTPSPALLLPSSSPSPTVWTAAPSPTTHSAPPSSSPTPSFQTKKPSLSPSVLVSSSLAFSPTPTLSTNSPSPSPTPSVLTPSPTQSSSPTLTCPNDSLLFQLLLTTDNYGAGTSWSLVDSNGAHFFHMKMGDLESRERHIYQECLPKESCYTFTIKAKFGSGICCWWGHGSFSIFYGGTKVASGGKFGSSASHIMGEACPSSRPTISEKPSSSPSTSFRPTTSQKPSLSPSTTPSDQPTTSQKPSSSPSTTQQRQEKEREVLMKLFTSTGGENWLDNTGWMEEAVHHCDWYGISCSNRRTGDGHVYKINLGKNGLDGTIPTEIGTLSNLLGLSLSQNDLDGAIPTEIGKLSSFFELNLYDNHLSGTIPSELGQLNAFFNPLDLDLSTNHLNGSIPSELGLISGMNSLNLSYNHLSGSIPSEIGLLYTLEFLFLSNNHLSRTIPSEVGILSRLYTLDLSTNHLSGGMPSQVGLLSNLNQLDLSTNNLSGSIPSELGLLSTLGLTTDWNHGQKPGWNYFIRILDLSCNDLSGAIPSEVWTLHLLSTLDLSINHLSGTMPSEVGILSRLSTLGLSTNHLSGSIPTELGKLTELEATLNLTSNIFTGTVPMELGSMSNIEKLDLNSNRLTDSMLHLGNSASFTYLNLSQNELISFPFSHSWTNLEVLDLTENKINQEISVNLDGLSSMKELFLSYNYFSGTIPNKIRSLARLETLHLDHNSLHGTIPDDVLSLVRLRELKLSHNGQERQCFPGFFLCGLDTSEYQGGDVCCNSDNGKTICSDEAGVETEKNDFCLTPALRGTIPVGFGNTPYLEVLDVSNNLLTGNIPPEIGLLSRIEVLNLANNTFTGSIPSVLGALVNAAVLVKGNSMITGQHNNDEIAPLSLCNNVRGFEFFRDPTLCPPERNLLRKFYFEAKGQEWTNSTGWVGEYNSHCEWHGVHCNDEGQVIKLTLGNGGLSGRISGAIGDLRMLQTVDLRDNDLKGSIPSEIGHLLNLTSLILSFNEITGTVPTGIANLSNLELLHLHDNRLQGTVPRLVLKGQTKSSFIADCGSPSDFDSPLDCPDCTMCCNSYQQCDVTTATKRFGVWAGVVMGLVFGFLCLVLLASLLQRKGLYQCFSLKSDAYDAVGKDSVYCFFLSNSITAWVLAIVVLVAQVICFTVYIDGATLVFDSDKDWVYQYVCPRDNLACRMTSDNGGLGWIFFAIFLAVHLLSDVVNGLKLVWNGPRYGLSWKTCQCLFGGICLCSISALALYSSVVYNVAISRSNLELIFNTVILLFVNDLDEKMYSCLETIRPKWMKMTCDNIKTTFSNNSDSGEEIDGEEIKGAILEHRGRIVELEEGIEVYKVNVTTLEDELNTLKESIVLQREEYNKLFEIVQIIYQRSNTFTSHEGEEKTGQAKSFMKQRVGKEETNKNISDPARGINREAETCTEKLNKDHPPKRTKSKRSRNRRR